MTKFEEHPTIRGLYVRRTYEIPIPSPEYSGKILLVGNAPSLLDKNNREFIDSYDEVVRLNDWTIDGYEKHVGTKTTHWISGCSDKAIVRGRDITGIHTTILYPARYYYTEKHIQKRVRRILQIDPNNVHIVKKKQCDRIAEIANSHGIEYPSTGLQAIIYMCFIKNARIDLIGFDFCRQRNRQTHYNSDNDREKCFIAHQWEREEAFAHFLTNDDRVRFR